MTITRNFKLCLNAGTQNAPYINANQYDEGEEWVFDLYTEGGQKFTPSTGAIIGIKSDGHAILNSGTVNSDGQVVITETQQMTAASGLAVFELLIEGETHGTANFIVNVERRPSDDAEFSDSDLSMLQEAIDAAEVINEILDEGGDPSEIITENVNAWLDNHPEATTTVEDGAITAPKINNSLWDKLLVSEEASGNPASFEDGADDVPVSSLKVALEPIQTGSGDPSPSNIRPIIAATGKNLLQVTATTQTVNGITYTVNADGTVTATGTATANADLQLATASDLTNALASGTNYILSGCPTGGSSSTYVIYTQADGNTIRDLGGGVTFSRTGDFTSVLRIRIYSGQTVNNLVFKPMIRLASITDSTYQPYQGIMVERTGVNQFDEIWELGMIASADGQNTNNTTVIRAKNYIPVYPNTQYYLSNAYGSNIYWFFYDANKTYLNAFGNGNDITVTTPPNAYYMRIRWASGYGTAYRNDTVINYPSSVTTYEPYSKTTYPMNLGQNVYGGSIDLATGVLTVTWGTTTLNGSEVWYNAGSNDQGWYTQRRTLAHLIDYSDSIICDRLETYKNHVSDAYRNADSGITGYPDSLGTYPTDNWIYAKGGGATTPTEFKTWLASNPLQVVYLLDTPTTVQLTPQEVKTLLGYNNISSTGTVDVIYHADTKLYIDKKIGELS